MKHVFLPTFKPEELIFDEEETKDILKFFFRKTFEAIAHDLVLKKPHVVLIGYCNPLNDRGIWG